MNIPKPIDLTLHWGCHFQAAYHDSGYSEIAATSYANMSVAVEANGREYIVSGVHYRAAVPLPHCDVGANQLDFERSIPLGDEWTENMLDRMES